MNGREHLFWGLMSYSVCIFTFTLLFDYKDAGWMTYAGLILFIVVSCLSNELGNVLVSRVKKINRERNKEKATPIKNEVLKETLSQKEKKTIEKSRAEENSGAKATLSSSDSKLLNILHATSYTFLGMLIVVATYTAIAAADIPAFVIVGYLCAFAGALMPDLDKTIVDIRYHRNPFTHSSMFVLVLGLYVVLTIPDFFISLMLPFIGFLMGNMAHLFCDNIESEGSLADIFSDFGNWKECPGDIRMIREDRERAWLNMNAFFLLAMIFVMFARFNFSSWAYDLAIVQATYDPIFETFSYTYNISPSAWILIGFTVTCYVINFIAFISWRREAKAPKKKGDEKGKKKESPRSKPIVVSLPAKSIEKGGGEDNNKAVTAEQKPIAKPAKKAPKPKQSAPST